jgi:hypothetical protein
MSNHEGPNAGTDDEKARRARAAEIHEQIDELKKGAPPDSDTPRQPSPREFTEHNIRAELDAPEHDEDGD